MAYKTTTIGLNSCLQSSRDMMLQAVLQYEKEKKLHPVVKESKKLPEHTNQEFLTMVLILIAGYAQKERKQ